MLIRYEDLTMNTEKTIRQIYEGFNLPRDNIEEIIETISTRTGSNIENEQNNVTSISSSENNNNSNDFHRYGTIARNGTKQLMKWMNNFDYNGVKAVQDIFGEKLMKNLGYHFLQNRSVFEKDKEKLVELIHTEENVFDFIRLKLHSG